MPGLPPRLPPPPFWRTRYFAESVVARPDRRDIHSRDILAGLESSHRLKQPDGRWRFWVWIEGRGKWLRIVTEADGQTVHNAFWDRKFKP
jgi:hypothetical protein